MSNSQTRSENGTSTVWQIIGRLVAAAVVLAVKKLTGGSKEPEYFDDNEFFECDNEIEIVEAKAEETVVEEAPAKEAAPKKKAPAKKKAAKKADAE